MLIGRQRGKILHGPGRVDWVCGKRWWISVRPVKAFPVARFWKNSILIAKKKGDNVMIHNAVIDCIHARRSTRHFQDRQIETEHLEALLGRGHMGHEAAVTIKAGCLPQS